MLSDRDFLHVLNKHVVIDPFSPRSLSPLGYDLRCSSFLFSLSRGVLEPRNETYEIAPGDTVLILTEESVWISDRLAGTIHSRVTLTAQGLSHISTTVDPGWHGPLLLAFTNHAPESIYIPIGERVATLLLHEIRRKASSRGPKHLFLRTLLRQHLRARSEEHLQNQIPVFDHPGSEIFEQKVRAARLGTIEKVLTAIRANQWQLLRVTIANIVLISLLLLLIALGVTWPLTSAQLFNGVPYDSKIAAAQIASIVAIALALHRINR